jgi:hypothetical protein
MVSFEMWEYARESRFTSFCRLDIAGEPVSRLSSRRLASESESVTHWIAPSLIPKFVDTVGCTVPTYLYGGISDLRMPNTSAAPVREQLVD